MERSSYICPVVRSRFLSILDPDRLFATLSFEISINMDFFRRPRDNNNDTRDTCEKTSEKISFDRSQLGSMPEDGSQASNVPTHEETELPASVAVSDEPKWPSGWRPYACLFGGFLLMFNSWGIVNVGVTVKSLQTAF